MGRLLVALQGGTVVTGTVFALAGEFWVAVAATLIGGLLAGTVSPLQTTWLAGTTGPASRATVFSLVGQVDATGQILGGPPLGVLGVRVSIRAALLATAILTVPAVALLSRARVVQQRVDRESGQGG